VNTPVLVLNANYAPLNICTTRRAMGLLLMEKAMIVSNGRGVIRTPSTTFLREGDPATGQLYVPVLWSTGPRTDHRPHSPTAQGRRPVMDKLGHCLPIL